jgi:hypothetical protein
MQQERSSCSSGEVYRLECNLQRLPLQPCTYCISVDEDFLLSFLLGTGLIARKVTTIGMGLYGHYLCRNLNNVS